MRFRKRSVDQGSCCAVVLCRRVMFITGDVVNEQIREFLESEERLCLTKPFTTAQFRNAIKMVTAKS